MEWFHGFDKLPQNVGTRLQFCRYIGGIYLIANGNGMQTKVLPGVAEAITPFQNDCYPAGLVVKGTPIDDFFFWNAKLAQLNTNYSPNIGTKTMNTCSNIVHNCFTPNCTSTAMDLAIAREGPSLELGLECPTTATAMTFYWEPSMRKH